MKDVAGTARAFVQGDWSILKPGVAIAANTILRTDKGARLLIVQGSEYVYLPAESKVQLDTRADPAKTLVRAFEGSVGFGIEGAPNPDLGAKAEAASLPQISVATSQAVADVTGGAAGVVVATNQTTVAVDRGAAAVTETLHKSTAQVTEGKVATVVLGGGITVRDATTIEPAALAANAGTAWLKRIHEAEAKAEEAKKAAAGGAPGDQAAKDAAADAAAKDAADKMQADLEKAGLDGKGEAAGNQDEAADKAEAELKKLEAMKKKKGKLGSLSGKNAEVAKEVGKELMSGLDVDSPDKEKFEWTYDDAYGITRLKPLSAMIIGLSGSEAVQFWPILIFFCGVMGAVFNAVLKDSGFGMFVNAGVIMLAFFVAVLLRDLLFRGATFIGAEPFMTLGLVVAAMTASMIGGAFLKYKYEP